MSKEENKKMISITVADISIRFPEIMEEEYKDLIEYLNDEHIVFTMYDNIDLQQKIDKAIEFVEDYKNQFQGDEVEKDMKDLLSILKGKEME